MSNRKEIACRIYMNESYNIPIKNESLMKSDGKLLVCPHGKIKKK